MGGREEEEKEEEEREPPPINNTKVLYQWDVWEVGERFKRQWTYVYLWLIQVDVSQKPT